MDEVFMDNTFSLSPPLFEQVFAMLVKCGEYVFPVLYVLLGNKQQVIVKSLSRLPSRIDAQFPDAIVCSIFLLTSVNKMFDHEFCNCNIYNGLTHTFSCTF